MLTQAFNILGVDSSTISQPGLQSTQMLAMLNDANMEWSRTFKRSGGEPPVVLERETGFDLVADTALAEAVTTDETAWDIDDDDDLDAAGAVVIWDDDMADIVEYTSVAANILSGVSGAGFAHEDGDGVQKLYALPSNFASFRSQSGFGDGVQVNGVAYWYTTGTPSGNTFTYYDNGTTKYLWLPRGVTGSAAVSYNKATTTIDDTADTVDVPPEYQFFLVYRLVEHGWRVLGDLNAALEAQQKANTILLEAQKERNVRKAVQVRPLTRRRGETWDYYNLVTRDS